MGLFLNEAEEEFGPRDYSYTPLGVEFGGANPRTWYPGDRRHVAIVLSENALKDRARAIFQLAHEVIHLLAPTGGPGATVIEEGLATLFSHRKSAALQLRYTSAADNRYMKAEALVSELLRHDMSAIRRVRKIEPAFSRLTPQMLLDVAPRLSVENARLLCLPFPSTE